MKPFLLLLFLAAPPLDEPLYVRASLETGLAPVCSFSLILTQDGDLYVTVSHLGQESKEVARRPTTDEVARVRAQVHSADFFSLPEAVGCHLIDGSEHHLRVHEGQRWHAITLYDRCGCKKCLSTSHETERAFSVWETVRLLALPAMPAECRDE